MSVRTKLIGSFALTLLLVFAMAGISVYQSVTLAGHSKAVQGLSSSIGFFSSGPVARLLRDAREVRDATSTAARRDSAVRLQNDAGQAREQLLSRGSDVASMGGVESTALARISELAGAAEEAAALLALNPELPADDETLNALEASRVDATRSINSLVASHTAGIVARDIKAASQAGALLWLAIALAGVSVVIAAMVVYLANRDITHSVAEVARVAEAVSGGDVSQRAAIRTSDEFRDLGKSLERMGEYLREVADYAERVAGGDLDATIDPVSELDVLRKALKQMGDNLRTLVAEASEAETLRQVDLARRQFLNNISHELRTPLGIIKAAISTIANSEEAMDSEATREYLVMADSECDRLNAMVSDLLQTARMGRGVLQLQKEPVEMAALVESLIERFRLRCYTHTIDLRIGEGVSEVRVDRRHLEQAISNLLDNATKYSPDGTRVEVEVLAEDDAVTLAVLDEGPGVQEEYREKVFDRFFRIPAEAGAGERPSGTGLGLAIAKGIIEAHGGRIWVEPRNGHGSRFQFKIPRE